MTMPELVTARREMLAGAAAGAALGLAACGQAEVGDKVTAVEELMREHGVLRRIMVLYRECAALLRANFSSFDGRQLWRAADLYRRFGESFHEQQLEEAHVFPQALKAGGEAALLVPVLIAQHARGREITAYVQAKSAAGGIAGSDAAPLAAALDAFSGMYEPHAAYEDTVVFQAWRRSLSAQQLGEAAARFAEIEQATFKGDGFAAAVAEVASIEAALGVHDLSGYTAPAPGAAPQGLLPTPVPSPADAATD
jgi:hemerythrin-like domain-containing protein